MNSLNSVIAPSNRAFANRPAVAKHHLRPAGRPAAPALNAFRRSVTGDTTYPHKQIRRTEELINLFVILAAVTAGCAALFIR